MADFFRQLTQEHTAFIHQQKVFFVATAPTANGQINVSPKGYDILKIVSSSTLLYADYYGSGNETAKHINENQKITLMWCSFDENPLILRVYGKGTVIAKDHDDFERLRCEYYPTLEARLIRQIFKIEIDEIQTSCGWGVPIMTFIEQREKLNDMSKKILK